MDGPLALGGLGEGKFLALLLRCACVRLLVFSDAGAFAAETPMDGATKFVNFLAEVPWEDASPEMMEQVKALLKYNLVTRVSHFAHLDVKKIRSDLAGAVPGGAIYGMRVCALLAIARLLACLCLAGFIQTAIKLFDRQYGSDDESERVAAPRTPKGDESNYGSNDGNYGGESRLEQALMSAMGKTRKVYEHINLEELMESKGLDWFFPPEVI